MKSIGSDERRVVGLRPTVVAIAPALVVSRWAAWVDRVILDGILHGSARLTVDVSKWDRKFDEGIIDGMVNLLGSATFSIGRSFRHVQTGRLRQYIMFIAVGVLTLYFLLFVMFPM